MRLVIDASVALQWVVAETGSDAADALLDEDLMAPELWLIEAANALWKKVVRQELTAAEAQARLEKLGDAPIFSIASPLLMTEALALAMDLNHPVYDCVYLALARREGCALVTADQRFHAMAQRSAEFAPMVRLLGA